MACDLATIKAAACVSGIGKEQSQIKLWQLIAQLTCEAAEGGGGGGGGTWGSITGTLSNQLDLQTALNAATIAARPLTGAGSPVGVVTPTYVGQFYTDLTGTQLFQASGLTNTDWIFWA